MFAVIGSASVDILIRSPDGLPQVDGDEFTSTSLVFTDDPPRFSPGGNACNAAYVLAGLGADAVLCSALGRDALGRMMRGWLEDVGVSLGALKEVPTRATSSTTIISAGSSRLSFHHPGALGGYGRVDLPEQLPGEADVLLVCAYPLLRAWRPGGYEDVLRDARRNGVTTALDVGPAVGDPVTTRELRPILPSVDYFICNSLELERCTGSGDLVDAMTRIAGAGAACVITKLGARGAAVLEADWNEPQVVPAFSVEAHGTVGAGDSFNAGFLYAVQQQWPLLEAVRFGQAVASIVIASSDGVMARPTPDEVERKLRA